MPTLATQYAVHAASVELADGSQIRFGPDEADLRDVPVSVGWDTELPGGFGPGSVVLPRPSNFDPIRAQLFSSVRIFDALTNVTYYEGRVTGTPQTGVSQIEVQTEGWSKHLEDNKTLRFLGIDRSFGNWGSMPINRRINLLTAGVDGSPQDPSVDPDPGTGASALKLAIQGPATEWPATCEGWYNVGLPIGAVDYAWKKGPNYADSDTNWFWRLRISVSDTSTGLDDTGNLRAPGPGSGTLTKTGVDPKQYAYVRFSYVAAGSSTTQGEYAVWWTLLGVIGDHGLPLGGNVFNPNTGRTLFLHDIVSYLVQNYAPLLDYTTGPNGSIASFPFGIPHFILLDDTTVADALQQLVLFGGTTNYPLDYGCWDNRQFFLREPGTYGRTWRARRDQATEQTDQGPEASTRINGVKVSYTDPAGLTKTVGPVGSRSDFETGELMDFSPNNPANNDGARHWEVYGSGIITTEQGATYIGQLILADRNRKEWRGDVTLKGLVTDDAGVEHPVAHVRAGDRIVLEDDADTSERRVVNTSYSDDQILTASCGAAPDKLDVLLARLGIVLEGKL